MRKGDTARQYDETSFWRKVRRFAFAAGRSVVDKALVLYFCMRDPDTPKWAKAVILGALGYFILPLDAIPDLLPGIGFTDDMGVMAAALVTLAAHVKRQHRERAREILEWKWAGSEQGRSGADVSPSTPASPAEVLGVREDAAPSAIRKGYLDQVKKYHPDKRHSPRYQEVHGLLEELYKKFTLAYEELSDPVRRRDYDESLPTEPPREEKAKPVDTKSAAESEPTFARRSTQETAMYYYKQGKLCFFESRFSDAVQCLREAVRRAPEKAPYHNLLAQALVKNPRWRKQAEEHFQKAITLDPFEIESYVHLGELYESMGFMTRAKKVYQEALRYDGSNEVIREKLQEERNGAMKRLKKFVKFSRS